MLIALRHNTSLSLRDPFAYRQVHHSHRRPIACYIKCIPFLSEAAMSLLMPWWEAIGMLRPAFSRLRTFLWFATAVMGFTVRSDLLGITSIVRALALHERYYL